MKSHRPFSSFASFGSASFCRRLGAVANIALVCAAVPARATTRTWICNWLNNNWATSTNWAPAGVPQNGDDLVIPAGTRSDAVNTIASLKANSITITSGATISGNAILVTNGIIWSGAGLTHFNIDVTLGDHQTFQASGTSLHFGGDIHLNGFNLTIDSASYLELNGAITGTGNVTKLRAGQMILGGSGTPNTFNGSFTHFAGELWAAKKPCFPGNFTSYDHTIIYSSGVFSSNHTISLHLNALLEANNDYTNTTANLIIAGARIDAFQMMLGIRSNLTSTASSTISEIITKLDLGNTGHTFLINNGTADPDLRLGFTTLLGGASGGFTKTGAGTL